MMVRSPRFRQLLLFFLLIVPMCLYIIINEEFTSSFIIRFTYTVLYFSLPSTLFNSFLFSAEAAFFDHLMITPDFRKILTARYILYLLISVILFFILLILHPFTWESLLFLIAVFFYSVGTMTSMSFCSILFIDKKMDLFGSYRKMIARGQSVQSFVITIIMFLLLTVAIIVYYLFSQNTAILFMMISGVLCMVFHQRWFNYLLKRFHVIKYEKIEIFRIQ
jgi:hypothetical protein